MQINEFEGGGVAIGLSCAHLHADPTAAVLLLKSWSDVHRGEPVAYPPFFHRPATANGLFSSPSHRADAPSTSATAMSSATFRFPTSAIKRSLARFRHSCPDATPFDLLAALLWTRVARLRQSQNQSQSRNHSLTICTDSRKLIDAPSLYSYFGNALHFSSLSLDASMLDKDALGHVVEAVHRHAAGVGKEVARAPVGWAGRMYGAELTCVSMEHMTMPDDCGESTSLMYAAMFQKGEKPLHVACHVRDVEGEGLIVVMPSPEGGFGRTVMLTLPEADMAKLREDQAVLDLDPTMLVSVAK